jgi:hypothetical protein
LEKRENNASDVPKQREKTNKPFNDSNIEYSRRNGKHSGRKKSDAGRKRSKSAFVIAFNKTQPHHLIRI